MRVLHAHDGGGLAFSARGPPRITIRLPTTNCLSAPARLRSRPYAGGRSLSIVWLAAQPDSVSPPSFTSADSG